MKVFISWSGDVSHKVALCLRDWIPSVLQAVTPYVSSEDIDKGARWSNEISSELQCSDYGIICVTPQNLAAPWLNFEAGALSKSFDNSRVSPFLFGVKRSEVHGPLLQFQSTIPAHDDVLKLIRSMNSAQTDSLIQEERLLKIFNVWWPELEKRLATVEDITTVEPPPPASKTEAILEEVLDLVRRQQILINSPERLLPKEYLESIEMMRRDKIYTHPVWREVGSALSILKQLHRELLNPIHSSGPELFKSLEDCWIRLREALDFIDRRMGIKIIDKHDLDGAIVRRRTRLIPAEDLIPPPPPPPPAF